MRPPQAAPWIVPRSAGMLASVLRRVGATYCCRSAGSHSGNRMVMAGYWSQQLSSWSSCYHLISFAGFVFDQPDSRGGSQLSRSLDCQCSRWSWSSKNTRAGRSKSILLQLQQTIEPGLEIQTTLCEWCGHIRVGSDSRRRRRRRDLDNRGRLSRQSCGCLHAI